MHKIILILGSVLLFANPLMGQTNSYKSPVDQDVTVKKVVLVPSEDNINSVYAKPVDEVLKQALTDDAQWNLVDMEDFSKFKTNNLYTQPDEVKKILLASQGDGLLKVKMTKGPKGLNAKMTLFTAAEGLPLVEESLENYDRFELQEVKSAMVKMLFNLKNKMPYRGQVLSRRGQEITVSLGKSSGLRSDTDISLVQILKLHRHPKHKFMVASEKEILGKARVFKVDDELSFATLLLEREPGVINAGTKVLPDEYVKYPEPFLTPDGKLLANLSSREDKDISYGAKPTEWLPDAPPQYGKFQGMLGFGQYTQSTTFDNRGAITGTNNLAPTISISGELWLNMDWFFTLGLRQSAFAVENQLGGSSPKNINVSLSRYQLLFGKNFLMGTDFFGPKIQLSGGFGKFGSRSDDTNPTLFTNIEYGGMVFNFLGQFPLSDEKPIDIGLKYSYYWHPAVNETKSSGSPSDVKVNDFGLFVRYNMKPKMSYITEIDFEYYSTDFSNGGDRTVLPANENSHKLTTLLVGIEYLF